MKIDSELLEITKRQIELDLKDLDKFEFERIENFRKFMQNMVDTIHDINTISLAVHECMQRVKLDLIRTPRLPKNIPRFINDAPLRIDLKTKVKIIEIYASSVAHYRALRFR